MYRSAIRQSQRGMTLIELLVALVVAAIIAAIAIPTYRQQVMRSNRSNAKVVLVQTAQNLERCFTRTSTFVGCVALPVTTAEGLYQVTGVIAATTYTLTATPLAGQAADTVCGNFTLNQANVRGVSGTGDVNDCWTR